MNNKINQQQINNNINNSEFEQFKPIFARLYEQRIEIEFRTLGNTFNPLEVTEKDVAENIKLLQGISSTMEYDYIMGMNCTQICIKKKGNFWK